LTTPTWDLVLAHVEDALTGSLEHHVDLSALELRKWARQIAREKLEVDRLPRGRGEEIDALVDRAIDRGGG
jgi:hypothetical protein